MPLLLNGNTIGVKKIGVIWNKNAQITESNALNEVETFGHIPYDTAVFDGSTKGKTVFELPEDNPVYSAIGTVLERFLALSPNS